MKPALANALLVGSGGFVGALLRYGLSGLVHGRIPLAAFPYGTLSVNLLGCLLIGLFTGFAETRQVVAPELRSFALIGLLGGFTTFSAFGDETVALLREGEQLRAAANVGLHVGLGLACVWLGYASAGAR